MVNGKKTIYSEGLNKEFVSKWAPEFDIKHQKTESVHGSDTTDNGDLSSWRWKFKDFNIGTGPFTVIGFFSSADWFGFLVFMSNSGAHFETNSLFNPSE